VGARDVELELGPEGAEAEQARDQRIRLGEPGQLLFDLADPLPSSRKLIGHAFPVPRTHRLNIGSVVTVLENRFTRDVARAVLG